MTRTDAEKALGTMKMKHPKRGGWKGPKKSKRNLDAFRAWQERKRKRNSGQDIHDYYAAYRKQIGETGRSVPQYSDPAGE